MNQLRVYLGGDNRGFQQMVDESLGIAKTSQAAVDEMNKKSAMAYEAFWTDSIAKKEAMELAAEAAKNEKILAMTKANAAAKAAIDREWIETQAAFKAIASGSGGHGSGFKTAEHLALEGLVGAAGGAGGAAAVMKAGEKSAGHAAEKGMDSTARREMLVMFRELSAGNYKRFFSSFTIFVQHLGKAASFIAEFAGLFTIIASIGGTITTLGQAMSASMGARNSAGNLKFQMGGLRGSLPDKISGMESSGAIDKAKGDQLRGMLGTDDGVLKAMREMVRLQSEYAAKQDIIATHAETLKELSKYERDERERTVNTETRLAMLLGDERDLKKEIAAADAVHDEKTFLEKSRELFAKEREISEARQKLVAAYKKMPQVHQSGLSQHIDSLSGAGLFTSAGAAMPHLIDVNQKQLRKLEDIHTAITSVKNIFGM